MRLAALVLFFAACIPAPVYRVQRTARVPHPAVPLRTGEPLAGPFELSFGASTLAESRTPRLADEQASVEVAKQQFRAEMRLRLGKRGELATIYEQADGDGSRALDQTQAPVERGSPRGYGLAARYSIDAASIAPGLSIGVGVEVQDWQIPYVEYRSCVENCEVNMADLQQMNWGTQNVGTGAFSVTPTYRQGNFAAFGGVYVRRHPTIVRKGTELYEMDYDQDVDAGPHNWMLYAGVEYRARALSFMLNVQQDLTRDPVWYGPSVGFAFAFHVPDEPRPPPPMPPPPPPQFEPPDDPW